ncbi:hypothetical protein DTO271D3_569 [Paecilomyces variotii]|nr:hypothetical protein DTO169E5_3000 [Paecilomyces variotii]KAJ9318981.1 hypothetical protein DTO271D3_569 [Paecilomyces variotii]
MVPPRKTRSASRRPAESGNKAPPTSETSKDNDNNGPEMSSAGKSGKEFTVPVLARSTRQKKITVSDSLQDYEGDIPEIVRSRIPMDISQSGLDPTLPPIHNLKDIFDDITRRAIQLGLVDFLTYMGSRKLRVVTMCSGTESPLLALEMVGKSLKDIFGIDFKFDHLFSAEIVVLKQAYIETNFHPPLIFRDVTQMQGSEAVTAYGALQPIPKNPDILIAGASCVDFSNLNNQKKSLEDKGESGSTFYGILNYAKVYRPPLVILENVKGAPWAQAAEDWQKIGYAAAFTIVDTKDYYIPQTRERGYMICIDQQREGRDQVANDAIAEWAQIFAQFERRASSPASAFILEDDDPRLERIQKDMAEKSASSRSRTANWSKYQARHQSYRLNNKLGYKRPLSKFQDHGSCNMPDFVWQDWSRVQPERIWDTLDMNFLRTLRTNRYDINYKERFLELSQGIDREIDTRQFGIVGCITPSGIPYITTRGGPLCGLESLSLQGLPLDRLILTRESQRDLQDLAGNAMSSTVVGTAILSALICGYKVLENGRFADPQDDNEDSMTIFPNDSYEMIERSLRLTESTEIEITEILDEAKRSSQLCRCEGQATIKRKGILQCSLCGHTACTVCSGNPAHDYHTLPNSTLENRKDPVEFLTKLKQIIPMRLILSGISEHNYDDLKRDLDCPHNIWDGFLESVCRAFGDELRFLSIKRARNWTVLYDGPSSRLCLEIHNDKVEWLLYVKPLVDEPATSINREIFGKPIARMSAKSGSLLEGQWEICAPVSSKTTLEICGTGSQIPAYESKVGLQDGHYFDAKVWNNLLVSGSDEAIKDLEIDVRGTYELLPDCGTACASLHRRLPSQNSPPVYLFLDPTKRADPQLDPFVFSFSHERLIGNARRSILGELSHKWRSADVNEEESEVDVFYRKWTKCDNMRLDTFNDSEITYRTLSTMNTLTIGDVECHNSNVVLMEFTVPVSEIPSSWKPGSWQSTNLMESAGFLGDFAWLIQKASDISDFEDWNLVSAYISDLGETICSVCAPKKPRTIWGLGRRETIVPYEDPFEAATYERNIKSRPSAFVAFSMVDEENIVHLKLAVNISTLLHQAYDNLVGPRICQEVELSWRLVPNAPDIKEIGSRGFILMSNKDTTSCSQPPNFRNMKLRPEQLRSLQWMISQEDDNAQPFQEEEVEEALLPSMMWRAEGKAMVEKVVRGGILADEVGYGKTAVTLGLIDTQSQIDKRRLIKDAGLVDGSIPLKATLIIVPQIMVKQWQAEIRKFLGNTYKLLVISTAASLKSKSIANFQEADIVLLSWSVFNGAAYYNRVEQFAAAPSAPLRDGRIFDQWFNETLESIANNVNILREEGPRKLLHAISEKRKDLKEANAYYTYVPSKRLKGKQFAKAQEEKQQVEMNTGHDLEADGPASGNKRKLSAVQKGKLPQKKEEEKLWDDASDFGIKSSNQDWTTLRNVLVHMFEFNRIVIDEFTYVNERRIATLLTLKARSKWVLSGTPPLNGFSDVKSIAQFLGLGLGIDEEDPANSQHARLAAARSERSDAEQFLSFKTPHSQAWHDRRHEVAQRFLDCFMRQNIAEIDEIPWTEHFCVVKLSAAETVIYLELYMQLMSQDLQLRRNGGGRFNNDQVARINELIGSSKSAQEALLKRCCSFLLDTGSGGLLQTPVTCDHLIVTRTEQLNELINDVRSKLKLAIWLFQELGEPHRHLDDFVNNVSGHNFGDTDVTSQLQPLIDAAMRQYKAEDWNDFFISDEEIAQTKSAGKPATENAECGQPEEEDEVAEGADGSGSAVQVTQDPDTKSQRSTKRVKLEVDAAPATTTQPLRKDQSWPKKPGHDDLASALREVAMTLRSLTREWVFRQRALRFLASLRMLQSDRQLLSCSVCGRETADRTQVHVLGHCGHIVCDDCVKAVVMKEECAVDGCRGAAPEYRVIRAPMLVEGNDASVGPSYGGSKLDALVQLLQDPSRVPHDDQVIVFAQFPGVQEAAAQALQRVSISCLVIGHADRSAAQKVLSFQANKAKVLVLNIGGENAAGLNIQCANHVVFLSPLLASSQYDYEATMTQAIGRSRRYGQKKHVHIYHFLAGATIDVNILQQRRRRVVVKRGEEFVLVPEEEIQGSDVRGWEGLSLGEGVV